MAPSVTETPAVNGINVKHALSDIPSCITAFANGEFLIVLDSPTRENEGDLIIAASHVTPAKAAFMIRYTSGYLCAPLPASRAAQLELPLMIPLGASEDPHRTAYAVTVDGLGPQTTTGISAADRASTARMLADGRCGKADFRRPGHILPLLVRDGGVRTRQGHTEAGWEFARLAGIDPGVALIGELVVDGVAAGEEGSRRPELAGSGMMRTRECVEFGREWGIKVCTIEDLVAHVVSTEGSLDGAAVNGV